MKISISSAIILLFLIPALLKAQQKSATIVFDEIVHDFGEISEAKGNVTHKFEFTNTGSEVLLVQNVIASCGCTTPSWTKQPVLPGEKGFVSTSFDPSNRPGHFDKYIDVQSNAANPSVRIRITGKVTPKPLSLEDVYKIEMGPVRLTTNHLSFGTVFKGKPSSKEVEILNTSDKPVKIELKNIPSHLQATLPPAIKPGETALINIAYKTELQPEWDFIIDRMDIYLNGTTAPTYRLVVSANMQEDFSHLSQADRAKAAAIEIVNKNFDFGRIKQGEVVQHEFIFKNTGGSELIVRKVHPSCGCTAVVNSNDVLTPGSQGTLKVVFNSSGKSGKQQKTITLITNDPDHPREILWIKGEVITN